MTTAQLTQQIRLKKSFLCIGLDTDWAKLPATLQNADDPVFEFNKAIIDATHSLAVAYKLNTAFYEARGLAGWRSLEKTIHYLHTRYPELFTIADAKRGDIGNTAAQYAQTFFEQLPFQAVTVNPYLGADSVAPFLAYPHKHTILLALTSNPGAADFQLQSLNGTELYKQVLKTSQTWKNAENLMYVAGATQAERFSEIRELVPDSFLLVPGIGAQGGSLEAVCRYGLNERIGLLVNVSRAILYASSQPHFAEAARQAAAAWQQQMSGYC